MTLATLDLVHLADDQRLAHLYDLLPGQDAHQPLHGTELGVALTDHFLTVCVKFKI